MTSAPVGGTWIRSITHLPWPCTVLVVQVSSSGQGPLQNIAAARPAGSPSPGMGRQGRTMPVDTDILLHRRHARQAKTPRTWLAARSLTFDHPQMRPDDVMAVRDVRHHGHNSTLVSPAKTILRACDSPERLPLRKHHRRHDSSRVPRNPLRFPGVTCEPLRPDLRRACRERHRASAHERHSFGLEPTTSTVRLTSRSLWLQGIAQPWRSRGAREAQARDPPPHQQIVAPSAMRRARTTTMSSGPSSRSGMMPSRMRR